MRRNDARVDAVHMFFQITNLVVILLWQTIARRIWNIYDRSTSLDDCFDYLCQIFVIRPTCILAIELHVVHETLGILRGSNSQLQNMFARRVELVLDVLVTRADTRVDALVLSIL